MGPGGPMGGPQGPAGGRMGPMGGPQGPNGVPGQGGPGGMGGPNGMPRQDQALTAQMLANAPPGMQKQMLGEKLYPAVARLQPDLAGKITGMMLEMDNSEVLMMLESEQNLHMKVEEA